MADISTFEPCYTGAAECLFLSDEAGFKSAIKELSEIADEKRPAIYKNMSRQKLEEDCRKFVAIVKESLQLEEKTIESYVSEKVSVNPDVIYLRHSNNNKVGSDFDFYFPMEKIWRSAELKLGSSTDVAASFNTVNGNIVPFSRPLEELHACLAERRKLWASGKSDKAIDIQQKALKETWDLNKSKIGTKISAAGQVQLNAYNRGITCQDEYSTIGVKREIIRISRKKSGFSVTNMSSEDHGDWILADICVTKRGRLKFDVLSVKGDIRLCFTLNWKNSYRLDSGEKVSAKYGLNSPSYNVWRRKPSKKQYEKFFPQTD